MKQELDDIQFRELITRQLITGNVKVNFTKKDGTSRDMLCTLINIPSEKQPKAKDPEDEVKYTVEALRVFDVEKQEWRSFRLDSVNSVTPV
jgi:hypothetical protein